jgi:crossover junction endodeoxyribonuclease RuvC
MRSLVLDQSTTTTGWAVVEESTTAEIYPGFSGKLISHGRINTPGKAGLVDRLTILRADIQALINAYQPGEMVIENTMFVQRSGATSNAMGAIYVACQEIAKANKLPMYSQNPSTIKKILTGHGKADKDMVVKAVCQYYGLPQHKILDDNHGDALGAAFVWLFRAEEVRAAKAEKKRGKRHVDA